MEPLVLPVPTAMLYASSVPLAGPLYCMSQSSEPVDVNLVVTMSRFPLAVVNPVTYALALERLSMAISLKTSSFPLS